MRDFNADLFLDLMRNSAGTEKREPLFDFLYHVLVKLRVLYFKMDVHTDAYQVLDKTVKSIGNSGGIIVPKKWVGRRVKVLLLEEVDEDE